MDISYYQDGKNRYLRIPSEELLLNRYKVKMLIANQPDNLLRLHEIHEGNQCYFDYHITGLVPLKDLSPQEILTKHLTHLLYALSHLEEELQQFLLNPKDILLTPDTIFIEPEKERFYFCYYPDEIQTLRESLEQFTEFLLKYLRPQNETETLLLYGLYQRSLEENVTFETIEHYAQEMIQEKEHQEVIVENAEKVTGIPVIEDDSPRVKKRPRRREDENIYQELGLSLGNGDALYEEWREKNKEDAAIIDSIKKESPYFQEEKEIKATPGKRFFQKMKDYAFEICVGIVVSTGVIIMILT